MPATLSRMDEPSHLDGQFLLSRPRRFASIAGWVLAALGGTVGLGWALGMPRVTGLAPGLATMKLNTAACFVLLGLACTSHRPRVVRVLGGTVGALSVGTLVEYALGVDFGIDAILGHALRTPAEGSARMAMATAAIFACYSASLLMEEAPALAKARESVLLLGGGAAFVALCGYAYDVQSLYAVSPYGTIAVHTTCGLLLGMSALLSRSPERGLMRVVTSPTEAGRSARRVGPALLALPAVVGGVDVWGQRAGWYGPHFGSALVVTATTFGLLGLGWRTARSLVGAEVERVRMLEELREANRTLESRVAARTEALRGLADQRAVLVREAHHRMKNSLQAVSGLVALHAESLDDPAARDTLLACRGRIRTMALVHEQLDVVEPMGEIEFAPYLRRLLGRALETMAPDPRNITLQLDLEEHRLRADAATTCALILNELVTNAAKHAFTDGRTGIVHISFRIVGGVVSVEVADDGGRMPTEADSGTTLGVRLVRLLVGQLGGTLREEVRGGTRITLEFPVPAGAS